MNYLYGKVERFTFWVVSASMNTVRGDYYVDEWYPVPGFSQNEKGRDIIPEDLFQRLRAAEDAFIKVATELKNYCTNPANHAG